MRPRPWIAALAALLLGLAVSAPAGAEPRYPGPSWDRAPSAEALGWSSDGLRKAREYAATLQTAAVMIVVDGWVLDEWGETAARFNVHSIRKSFLSALFGIHVKEGRIGLARTLAELGIDDLGGLTPLEKQATVADLLKARSGVYHPAAYETPAMKAGRPARSSYRPGAFWYYNNWDFNALGTIFEQATAPGIFQNFRDRIARPLEMEDFRLEDGTYVRDPQSIHPAYVFRMTARDLARFGLLYLREGVWRGKPLIPREWVEESTRSYADLGQWGGYGYMWWVSASGPHFTSADFKGPVFSARGGRWPLHRGGAVPEPGGGAPGEHRHRRP